jgi:mRNA interferase RelE/StbE
MSEQRSVEGKIWKVVFHRQAEKVLHRLPKDLVSRLWKAIQNLASNPRPEGCKKLEGHDNLYRIRVGDWRISYAVEDDTLIILILEIAPGGGAYRKSLTGFTPRADPADLFYMGGTGLSVLYSPSLRPMVVI